MTHRILPRFMTKNDCEALAHREATVFIPDDWEEGRQQTGYQKKSLLLFCRTSGTIGYLAARALRELKVVNTEHDVYLLKYPPGAYVPPHVDEVDEGKRHVRLNVLVQSAKEGGHFYLDGELVILEPGDGVIFEPDTSVHHVTDVRGDRDRLVFSVGALLPRGLKGVTT